MCYHAAISFHIRNNSAINIEYLALRIANARLSMQKWPDFILVFVSHYSEPRTEENKRRESWMRKAIIV